ncbi:MAG: tetratricopeptide repeat protein [Prevotellaceae bacterium]|jgi:cytochrome c-type biogenesis protein CcmH/NrfG|nr:tetratricopeptide repeat protein [Prevotellaceae bacterium]
MTQKITKINTLDYQNSLMFLNEHIAKNPTDDNAYYLRGNIYRKMNMFGDALNDYHKALELNPQSQAAIAIEILNEILAFRNTDLLNP